LKHKKLLFLGLATGLLALGGWKAFSHFRAARQATVAAQWICPMRCLNRVYDREGDCDVCHMKLKPYQAPIRKKLGYHCPLHRSDKIFDKGGPCPFCGLQLKELFDGPRPPQPASSGLRQWPLLNGKTAVYFRPYEVRKLRVERILRSAGPLLGRRLSLRLPKAESRRLKPGGSAMVMPPQGFARPVQAEIESVDVSGRLILRLSRPLPGVKFALAELLVYGDEALAVPLEALSGDSGQEKVYVMHGEDFEPRAVTVTARGESYAAVSGLEAGETVAGAGVFWLEAHWRMEHP
jgi:hypothetical protein